jgi:nitroreductase
MTTQEIESVAEIDAQNYRTVEYGADSLFVRRWSPRAMSGEEIPEHELMTLVEAAKWAPSCFNNQPWRFLYGRRNTPQWNIFFDLLADANKAWTKNAAVLMVVISKKTFDYNGKPDRTHSYDAGAAWENLALQGSLKGWVVHGMAGFDYDKARAELNIPEDYQVEAMAAIGRPGKIRSLPEKLREREKPSGRKALSDIIMEGKFKVPEQKEAS